MAGEPKDIVTEDVGAVQGSAADEADTATGSSDAAASATTDDVPAQPAPDAGEIEWAGGLIQRPPAPQN